MKATKCLVEQFRGFFHTDSKRRAPRLKTYGSAQRASATM